MVIQSSEALQTKGRSPARRQGEASNRESSAARQFLGVACAMVAVGSELDLSSNFSINQLGVLGSSNLSLSVFMCSVDMATSCPRTN